MDLISVIIPVYNTAEYLPRCLDSVLNNTYRNLEVICINDGSTDNSAEILQQYAQQDSRIVIITQENAGVSAARNAGLDRATGDFVAFIDSDDWVHVRYFEVLIKGALENNADIVICGNIQVDRWIADADIPQKSIAFRKHNVSCVPAIKSDIERNIWERIYKKELIGDYRFPLGVKLAEDFLFNFNLIYSNGDISCVICQERLYYYYTRWASASHTLGGQELKPLIMWYLDHASQSSVNRTLTEQNNIYEAFKALYSWRYGAILSKSKDELREIKELLNVAMDLLWQFDQIPLKQKMIFSILTVVPFFYRCFRIFTDPTMLSVEKRIKAEQRAKKKIKE